MKTKQLNPLLIPSEDQFFMMTSLAPSMTGLGHRIWIVSDMRREQRSPFLRLEVSDGGFYPVSIDAAVVKMRRSVEPGV